MHCVHARHSRYRDQFHLMIKDNEAYFSRKIEIMLKSYELVWSEWVHQWAESNTRISAPLQYLAFSSIKSKCRILLFPVPRLSSTNNGAQKNSIEVSKSCQWELQGQSFTVIEKENRVCYIWYISHHSMESHGRTIIGYPLPSSWNDSLY